MVFFVCSGQGKMPQLGFVNVFRFGFGIFLRSGLVYHISDMWSCGWAFPFCGALGDVATTIAYFLFDIATWFCVSSLRIAFTQFSDIFFESICFPIVRLQGCFLVYDGRFGQDLLKTPIVGDCFLVDCVVDPRVLTMVLIKWSLMSSFSSG